jgi:hypothetical protein
MASALFTPEHVFQENGDSIVLAFGEGDLNGSD